MHMMGLCGGHWWTVRWVYFVYSLARFYISRASTIQRLARVLESVSMCNLSATCLTLESVLAWAEPKNQIKLYCPRRRSRPKQPFLDRSRPPLFRRKGAAHDTDRTRYPAQQLRYPKVSNMRLEQSATFRHASLIYGVLLDGSCSCPRVPKKRQQRVQRRWLCSSFFQRRRSSFAKRSLPTTAKQPGAITAERQLP